MQKVPSLSDLSDPESSLGKSRSSPDVTWRHRSALGFHFSVVSSFSCVCVCVCVSVLLDALLTPNLFVVVVVFFFLFYYCCYYYILLLLFGNGFNEEVVQLRKTN